MRQYYISIVGCTAKRSITFLVLVSCNLGFRSGACILIIGYCLALPPVVVILERSDLSRMKIGKDLREGWIMILAPFCTSVINSYADCPCNFLVQAINALSCADITSNPFSSMHLPLASNFLSAKVIKTSGLLIGCISRKTKVCRR